MAAFIVDHQKPNLKHFCKICKKGFGCGRALGGHMRAHGLGDDATALNIDDDDPGSSDWEDHNNNNSNHNNNNNNNSKANVGPTNRRMYALRTNPNRLKTCRVCENCGKEFLSWKSFLEHGKCTTTSDDLDSLLSSPPCSDDDEEDDDDDECPARRAYGGGGGNNNNWSKRKRSLRVKVGSPASNEEEDLANCLMMLSNGTVEPMLEEGEAEAEAEESCASASKKDHHHHHNHVHHVHHQGGQDVVHHHHRNNNNNNIIRKPINFIPPLSYRLPDQEEDNQNNKAKGKGMFECKACKKVFNSHQALGGHRASHKKVKGCFAARLDHMDLDPRDNDDVFDDSLFPTKPNSSAFHYDNGFPNHSMPSTSKRKTKVHECSICHRIFSSGQALGGHKRCHWITSNANANANANANVQPPSSIAKFHDHHTLAPPPAFDTTNSALDLKLDLNLPAPADELRRPPFQVSTDIYLQSWVCKSDKVDENECEQNVAVVNDNERRRNNNNIVMNNNNSDNDDDEEKNISMIINNHVVEEEADSKVKLAKLSELKDMNMSGSGNSSPWLQVGIGSTTDIVTPDP